MPAKRVQKATAEGYTARVVGESEKSITVALADAKGWTTQARVPRGFIERYGLCDSFELVSGGHLAGRPALTALGHVLAGTEA